MINKFNFRLVLAIRTIVMANVCWPYLPENEREKQREQAEKRAYLKQHLCGMRVRIKSCTKIWNFVFSKKAENIGKNIHKKFIKSQDPFLTPRSICLSFQNVSNDWKFCIFWEGQIILGKIWEQPEFFNSA